MYKILLVAIKFFMV